MVALKRLIVAAILIFYLQPTLEMSMRQIYDNAMLASLRNTNDYRPSYKSSYSPSRKSSYRPSQRPSFKSSYKYRMAMNAKHLKTHKYDTHIPNSYWHMKIHKGVDEAKDKISANAWYNFGKHRWIPHVPYPYYNSEIEKGVEVSAHEVRKVLKDFWWDLGNDKWRYGVKQLIAVVSGIVGAYTRTSALGVVSGPLFGYLFASAEHYLERRFLYEDYKNKTLEARKDLHVKLMHPGIIINTTKSPYTSDESYENE